jgi:tRNA(Ser,Leu) C12 N-acetylase TAN1
VSPNWNAVVMTGPGMVMKAVKSLGPLGEFRASPHGGVAIGVVAASDVLAAATALYRAEPQRFEPVQRLVPIESVTVFERADVTETLCHALEASGPRIAARRFYVRCRLRGMDQHLEARAVERAIGSYLWELAEIEGAPAKVSFDDPDVVIAIEVIGNTVGYSFLGRCAIRSPLVRPR